MDRRVERCENGSTIIQDGSPAARCLSVFALSLENEKFPLPALATRTTHSLFVASDPNPPPKRQGGEAIAENTYSSTHTAENTDRAAHSKQQQTRTQQQLVHERNLPSPRRAEVMMTPTSATRASRSLDAMSVGFVKSLCVCV